MDDSLARPPGSADIAVFAMICQVRSGDLHERMHLRVTRQNDLTKCPGSRRKPTAKPLALLRRTSGGGGGAALGKAIRPFWIRREDAGQLDLAKGSPCPVASFGHRQPLVWLKPRGP